MAGVGTQIQLRLAHFGISIDPNSQGCRCWKLAREMDKLGPDGCRRDLNRLTTEMMDSIKQWRQNRGGVIGAVMRPPRPVVRELILWGIALAEEDLASAEKLRHKIRKSI